MWTGTEVLVFGGHSPEIQADGGAYNPITNTWRALATRNAPSTRMFASAAWTGEEMIVFGGLHVDSATGARRPAAGGGAYSPATDTWRSLPLRGSPSARNLHTAVWTGAELIVFGGAGSNAAPLGDGARYDPRSDTWAPLPLEGAPSPRQDHSAQWTQTELIIFGGSRDGLALDDGAAFDPAGNVWRRIAGRPKGQGAAGAASAWTGSELLVFGGAPAGRRFSKYIPSINAWSDLPMNGAPSNRASPFAALADEQFLVFGGENDGEPAPDGGQFDLRSETWSPIPSGLVILQASNAGAARIEDELILWGGKSSVRLEATNEGFRWDTVRGTRRPLPMAGAPSPRFFHTLVASPRELVVFGGQSAPNAPGLGDGASYDIVEDRWAPLPMSGAPSPRTGHTAVFTGREVIVWGGRSGTTWFGDGARLDLEARHWLPMTSTSSAPRPRSLHTAVWTGSELIVWGGFGTHGYLADGGRYDPAQDRWMSISREGAPSPRAQHTAVWTGSELIVWGGHDGTQQLLGSGGRYDPVHDRWRSLPLENAPSPRVLHSATWSGAQMVIFGGFSSWDTGARLDPGARYDPELDAWLPLPTERAPAGRVDHAAVWMGRSLVIFGGSGFATRGLADGALLDL